MSKKTINKCCCSRLSVSLKMFDICSSKSDLSGNFKGKTKNDETLVYSHCSLLQSFKSTACLAKICCCFELWSVLDLDAQSCRHVFQISSFQTVNQRQSQTSLKPNWWKWLHFICYNLPQKSTFYVILKKYASLYNGSDVGAVVA